MDHQNNGCQVTGVWGIFCREAQVTDPDFCVIEEHITRENPADPAVQRQADQMFGGVGNLMRGHETMIKMCPGCPKQRENLELVASRKERFG